MRIITISSGDPYGIGPEIILKALIETVNQGLRDFAFVVFMQEDTYEFWSNRMSIFLKPTPSLSDISSPGNYVITWKTENDAIFEPINLGKACANGGIQAKTSLDAALNACIEKKAHALCTAPISKHAMQLGKTGLLGHTEYLAERAAVERVIMVLANKNLRVALQTVHIPISQVASEITQDKLYQQLHLLNQSCKERLRIDKPKIAVLGLNPHAGEDGHIGREEIDQIIPVIKRLKAEGLALDGCFAADGFFGSQNWKNYDIVLAMYHDQGLAPFKAISFGGGVNFTLGLPFFRSSPDHGTAYSIAGKAQASHTSMLEALKLAAIYA